MYCSVPLPLQHQTPAAAWPLDLVTASHTITTAETLRHLRLQGHTVPDHSYTMWCLILVTGFLLHCGQCSLMSRIGLRLGAAHNAHHKSGFDHKPRQPWAVKNMKAEMLANERKPWQPLKQSIAPFKPILLI